MAKIQRNIEIYTFFWINIWYIDKIIVFLPQKKAKMLKGSRFYTKALDATSIPTTERETKIIVKNDDSIHCGHQLQQEGYNPVVLNLASRRTLAVVSVYRQNYNHQIINEMNEAYSENLSLITEYNIRNKK